MARQSTSPEQWAQAKALWEGEAKTSYADVGASLGISKQAVAKKAKADKWQKRMDLKKVVNRAHEMADRSIMEEGLPLATFARGTSIQSPKVDGAPPKKGDSAVATIEHVDAEPVDMSGMTLEERAEAIAVRKRAEILTRHRQELNAVRAVTYAAINKKDFELSKVGKINAEAITIIQNAERKAWGLDKGDNDAQPVIIIERG